MQDCIFCRIAAGDIPSNKVYEDDLVIAFHDLAPQAPVHVLIVPKQHVSNLLEARALPDETLARLFRVAADLAVQLGIDASGFRIVSNTGDDAGQTVGHLHIHLFGGKKMPAQMV